MLDKAMRNQHYTTLLQRASDLFAISAEREKANPSMKKSEELRAAAEDTVEKMIEPAMSLLLSTVEALHVIAQGTKDQAATFRALHAMPVKD